MLKKATVYFFILFFSACFCFAASCNKPEGIINFYKIEDGLYRGGYPTQQGLKNLKQIGVKTIIDFRNHGKDVSQEKRYAKALGTKYINIPFGFLRTPPEDAQIKNFLEVVKDSKNRPVFIHCQHGTDRTGMMVATYRIAAQGWSCQKAYQEAKSLGFHSFYIPMRNFIFNKAEKFKTNDQKKD